MHDSEYNKMSGVLYDKPGKIEHYEKRFGLIAIDKGFICTDDLVKVLTIQVGEDVNNAPHRLMGKILYDLGVMTDKQVEDVLSDLFHQVKASMSVDSSADEIVKKRRPQM